MTLPRRYVPDHCFCVRLSCAWVSRNILVFNVWLTLEMLPCLLSLTMCFIGNRYCRHRPACASCD